jgi:hypothetical protein
MDNPERLWQKADLGDGCWEWSAATTGGGYGIIYISGAMEYAHRVAWSLDNNNDPGDGLVLHECDNKRCVNPDHLYLGDRSDNLHDAYERGQKDPDSFRGENHVNSKLTEEDVRDILDRPDEPRTELADEFGVAATTISRIMHGTRWGHMQDE